MTVDRGKGERIVVRDLVYHGGMCPRCEGCRLLGAVLARAARAGADLRGAELARVDLGAADLRGARVRLA